MLLAVYGSLRKGCGLNSAMGTSARYVGTDRIFGYDMYHNGTFPYAIPSEPANKGNNSILVEVWDVDEEHTIKVANIELSAGYKLDAARTAYGITGLFVYHRQREDLTRILNGDFVEWCKKYHEGNSDFYDERAI